MSKCKSNGRLQKSGAKNIHTVKRQNLDNAKKRMSGHPNFRLKKIPKSSDFNHFSEMSDIQIKKIFKHIMCIKIKHKSLYFRH